MAGEGGDKVGRRVFLRVRVRVGGGGGGEGVWRWDVLGLLTLSLLLSTPCSCAPPEHASPRTNTK